MGIEWYRIDTASTQFESAAKVGVKVSLRVGKVSLLPTNPYRIIVSKSSAVSALRPSKPLTCARAPTTTPGKIIGTVPKSAGKKPGAPVCLLVTTSFQVPQISFSNPQFK
ncbi:hypothetical protein DSO57_1008187 [Entomophthora muscae]|uniref:Uncharacterized protein n=1 Tax=Entomophthora muscae TaxID=34485 RepID=A0ACC2U564_9FUNG|nr:hypothetical protein DSO57_1008187 [Entomophthora muscae]